MEFETVEATWSEHGVVLSQIRHAVFVDEQGFSVEDEVDGLDAECAHVLCRLADGEVVGTGRLLPDGHIGRIAVLKPHRGNGMGAAITRKLVDVARDRQLPKVYLHSQMHATPFYEKLGFKPFGEQFDEAGAPHQGMSQELSNDS
ncbi:MAG: GNAT family N-acetyltransferase [Verrucomicrobiota bacterium]